ncbi:MAG: glycosyltransferase [Gaiellaceae bacterium]
MTSFSVVIPTLRRPEPLRGVIESLLACVPLPDEIIIVDGDPEESARHVVDELASNTSALRLVYLVSETGSTRQRNRGIDASTCDVLVFLDDDVVVDTAIFAHFADAYRDSQLVGVTGNVNGTEPRRIGSRNSRLRRWLIGTRKQGTFTRFGYPRYLVDRNREQDVERQPGGLASARREAAVVTRFDELLTGYAVAEDEDFSYRLSRLGRVRYVPSISIWHEQHGVRDQRAVNTKLVLNRTYLFKKNFPQTALARTQFGFFLATLLAHRLMNREWDAARGLLDGYRELWRRQKLLDDPRSFILGTRVETEPPSGSKT